MRPVQQDIVIDENEQPLSLGDTMTEDSDNFVRADNPEYEESICRKYSNHVNDNFEKFLNTKKLLKPLIVFDFILTNALLYFLWTGYLLPF